MGVENTQKSVWSYSGCNAFLETFMRFFGQIFSRSITNSKEKHRYYLPSASEGVNENPKNLAYWPILDGKKKCLKMPGRPIFAE